jgi:polyhydroxyalkanoate synthase
MTDRKHEIATIAAQTTTAFNPVVGAQFSELVKSAAHVAGRAAFHPGVVSRQVFGFLQDASRIIRGNSELRPHPKDRRFIDPTWTTNPLYRQLLQFWLALRASIIDCIEEIDLEKTDRARAVLLTEIIVDSLAPTNTLLGNPAALKRMFETGGSSLVRGLRNAYDDFVSGNSLPAQVDSRNFEVGNNLANTEGAVVFRNDMLELIQYSPLTGKVHEIPLLIIPPQINKYYVLDLTAEKSLIRYLVSQGYRVFCISWFNAGPAQENWGLDSYVNAIMKSMDVVLAVTRHKKLNVMGACSGGITISTTMSHLAATGDDRVNSCTLQVCVLDPRPDDTEIGALMSEASVEYARNKSSKKGILSGDELAKTFAWMRPNDLIWNYFINNYLMGENPPAFDVLHWNNDSTNLPAALHSDFLDYFVDSPFANPGTVEFMGQMLDLSAIKQDIFISSGLTDHITPWRACYRSVDLFGGDVTFVVSTSGHIQSLINPPGNPKAHYLTSSVETSDSSEWLDHSEEHSGSWWGMWNDWLSERSGEMCNAQRQLGNAKYPTLDRAPGLYVFG